MAGEQVVLGLGELAVMDAEQGPGREGPRDLIRGLEPIQRQIPERTRFGGGDRRPEQGNIKTGPPRGFDRQVEGLFVILQPFRTRRKVRRRPRRHRADRLAESIALVRQECRRLWEKPREAVCGLDAERLAQAFALGCGNRRQVDGLHQQNGRIVFGRHALTRHGIEGRQIVDIAIRADRTGDKRRLLSDGNPRPSIGNFRARRGTACGRLEPGGPASTERPHTQKQPTSSAASRTHEHSRSCIVSVVAKNRVHVESEFAGRRRRKQALAPSMTAELNASIGPTRSRAITPSNPSKPIRRDFMPDSHVSH